MDEAVVLHAALALYAGALGCAMLSLRAQSGLRTGHTAVAVLSGGALLLHTLALVLRWQAHGHGPFTTMHEILSSSLWSLALVYALAWFSVREVRATPWAVSPVLLVMAIWTLLADARPGHMPPTYATPLLYLHTLVGKLFLGLLLVAVALGAVPWLRRTPWGASRLISWPGDRRFDELAHRFAAFAFVFETLMLIVGAVWAQDAWGRYWAWDPLESWAFVTWVALAAALHARATLRPTPAAHGMWLAIVFAIAFLTFFGVPFISVAPHKGAV